MALPPGEPSPLPSINRPSLSFSPDGAFPLIVSSTGFLRVKGARGMRVTVWGALAAKYSALLTLMTAAFFAVNDPPFPALTSRYSPLIHREGGVETTAEGQNNLRVTLCLLIIGTTLVNVTGGGSTARVFELVSP